ncbi:EAL domain-containing protein [Pseudonocardia parietis]|uniref:EAL domain-containing protein (Putative c-di-GMP-specific phosphodiesterase class I)/CBS domain-containing protein n=1 Tax=Pseudonocardia parietis TaxID=570936 RepID=A0ABS4W3U8_9PSEU|nr:EAL domain-containing protein [Pseudonocardia parietis]MBP2370882.1 EAL domain-containing protein (putative c-di-GMP-specific phosphodiesterase class I)/CBS domain-containing protein [Pseudonocardia parietis]
MTDERFAYEPVHDLRSGRFAGVEVVPRRHHDAVAAQARDRGWSARQIAELDASTAVSAVASARAGSGAAPVQVDVAADTVLYARDRLRPMLDGTAVAPMLEIGPPIAAAAAAEYLVPALAELRRWGFRIGLDGAGRGFGPDVVAAVRPDVVKLEPELSDGVLDAGAGAVVRAVLEVSRVVGAPVAATGVRDPGRLVGLYTCGVVFAQGPLLGGARPVPGPSPATGPELLALLRATPVAHAPARTPAGPGPGGATAPAAANPAGPPVSGPPVRGLATPTVTLPEDATGGTAREILREHPDSAGVVLVDPAHRPVGYLDRSRFLLNMTGRFGHALWADKPARSLADPPRTVDERTPLARALELSLSGDPARGYDDLVVVAADGTCRGVVAVAELWRRAILPGGPGTGGRPVVVDGAPRGRPVAPHGPGPAPATRDRRGSLLS